MVKWWQTRRLGIDQKVRNWNHPIVAWESTHLKMISSKSQVYPCIYHITTGAGSLPSNRNFWKAVSPSGKKKRVFLSQGPRPPCFLLPLTRFFDLPKISPGVARHGKKQQKNPTMQGGISCKFQWNSSWAKSRWNSSWAKNIGFTDEYHKQRSTSSATERAQMVNVLMKFSDAQQFLTTNFSPVEPKLVVTPADVDGKWGFITGWWFQPIWKILVKMGIFPK